MIISPTRWVSYLSFALTYHYFKLDVRYWHMVNLSIHLLNAILVWWLTLLILSSPVMRTRDIAKHKRILAVFAGLLFVSHPLATESVTYIVQRMNSLAAMFYLLSLVLFVKGRLLEKRTVFKYLLFCGSLFSALIAFYTKENAFTLPFAILLFEIFFLSARKISIKLTDYRVVLISAGSIAFILFLFGTFSTSIFKPIPTQIGHAYSITPFTYLFTQFSVIIKYIQLLILPINQMIDYDFPVSYSFFEFRTMGSFIIILGLILLAVFQFKRNRLISFGIFWFFLTLSVESSIIPINDVVYEHRTYLPSYGFFLVFITIIYSLLWKNYKPLAIAFFFFFILINSFLTYERNKIWKDEITLWADNISKTPNKARPYVERGFAYSNSGQWDKAIIDYTRSIRINPIFLNSYINRGSAYEKLGRWVNAIEDFSQAIRIDSTLDVKMHYYQRGFAFSNLYQWDNAMADYNKAIEMDSLFSDAYTERGLVFYNINMFEKAIRDFSTVINIDPGNATGYFNRGLAYEKSGNWDNAIEDYSKSLRINPKYQESLYHRGLTYCLLDKLDKAINDFTSTVESDPGFANGYFNRGISYVKVGQLEKAKDDFTRVLEIDPNYTTARVYREIISKRLKNKKY